MKTTKKAISLLLVMALVVSMLAAAVVSTSAAAAKDNPYSDAAMALDSEYAYDGELGAIYSPEATTFKVWAPLAQSDVKLNLYATGSDDEEGAQDLGTYTMEKLMDGDTWTGVWTYTVEGDIVNTYYTYTIVNPQHIYNSKFNATHETQDVYSYAVGVNGNRSMVVDLDTTDPDGWDSDSHVFVDTQTDAIIWEVQVKDFSYAENSGVSEANRGKFLGFTETGTTLNNAGQISTCVDYLKELGITHVQINPFYDFATIDESSDDDTQFNWGYDPKNYGAPEGSFSTNPYDGNVRIKECKEMIKALHDAGIGVVMDVVYNHTYSTDSCFNYSVPEYYYRMESNGGYSQQSGCGNDTASERAMYRKYMRDMLTYWTNEYHLDGFRFDLMGVHDGETMNLIRDDMDAIDPRILMYGEAWSGNTTYDPVTCAGTETFMTVQANAAKFSSRIGLFNDQIRDGIKGKSFGSDISDGFVTGAKAMAKSVSLGVRANTEGKGNWKATTPEQCLTYEACHDGKTMYDQLVALNYGETADYSKRYADVIAMNKEGIAILGSSQGIEFILAGEEMGRTKFGDHNSYKSSPEINKIDWNLLRQNADLVSYYKGMFELRKAFSPFTANVSDSLDDSYEYIFESSTTASASVIGYTVHNNTEGEWNKIAVMYNGQSSEQTFTFKGKKDTTINADTEWVIVANDKAAGVVNLGETKGLSFTIPATSAIIAVEKSTFEECAVPSSFSRVYLNSVYEGTGEVLAQNVIIGTPGTGYSVEPDNSIPLEYELSTIDGDSDGVFSDGDSTVVFNYIDYVPTMFRAPEGDVNDDGEVSIIDATVLQRFFAAMVQLDEEHEARGDYDGDGSTEIPDVTMLQRFFADMIKPVYSVTARYLAVDSATGETKEIADLVTRRVRFGEEYETSPATIAYYKLDETPANAAGIAHKNVIVNYYYSYSVASPVMHVKHSGDETWAPSLWAWAYDQNGQAINCYSGWPGLGLTNPDDDGWYTTTFPIPGGLNYYFIISKNGSPQTKDYGVVDGQNVGISYDDYPEIWVVIQDDLVGKNNGDWCKYYNYNPDTEN